MSNSDLNRETNIEMNKKEDNTEDELVKADAEQTKNVDSNDEANSDDNIQSGVKSVENIETDAAADDKKIDAGDMAQTDGTDDKNTMDAQKREQSKIIDSLTTDSSMQETADEYHEQPDSHDGLEGEYIYVIGHEDIAKVAQEIMGTMKRSYFKKKDLKTVLAEENKDRSNIHCLILFNDGTSGCSRIEDCLMTCRQKHQKVTCIIIVCVCKDDDENDIKDCSEQHTYSKDQDIVFKYHIKADGSPHECSSDVINKIQSHVHGLVSADEKKHKKQKKKQNMLKIEGQKLKEKEQTDKDLKAKEEVHGKLERTDEHPEQPGGHKMDYIYVILEVSNEKVAEEIMKIVKKESTFKKIDSKTAVKEINDRNNIACLIVFQSATSGSSRSDDHLNACRNQYQKVTNIIMVCVCKDNNENHYKHCSEQLVFSKEQDIVFKYHIKADGSEHDCSSNVIKSIRSHVHTIVMRNNMKDEIKALTDECQKLKEEIGAKEKKGQEYTHLIRDEINKLMEEKKKLEEDIKDKREKTQKLSLKMDTTILSWIEDNPAAEKKGHQKFTQEPSLYHNSMVNKMTEESMEAIKLENRIGASRPSVPKASATCALM